MPLTISFLFLYLPLKFHFSSISFFISFHCLLLPLHSPINSSLILLFNTLTHLHTNPSNISTTPLYLYHLFHSLILRVFKTSRRREASTPIPPATFQRLHHHYHLKFTALSCLLPRIQGSVGFEFVMLSIWCKSIFLFKHSYEFLFVACLSFVLVNMT